jgi:hypothetical protein
MKKLMILMILLAMYPMSASVNCLDNSQHLAKDFDDKEWHSVACDCPCTTIRKGYCVECGHLQNASTYVVVQPAKVVQNNTNTISKMYALGNPQEVLRKLARQYLENKIQK